MSITNIDNIVDNQIDNIIDVDFIKKIERSNIATVSSFSPSDISNLVVRFNADFGITESDGAIVSWTDQKNGTVATASNGPILISNQLNGRKAVSFDGSDDYFMFSLPSPITDQQKRTFVIIGRYNDPLNNLQQGYLNTQIGDLCYILKNSEEDQSYYYSEGRQLQGPSISLQNYHITTVNHNGVQGENFIRINGITSFNISYGSMDSLPQIQNFVMGARFAQSEVMYGEIVELLIYDKELTTEEIQQIETYANIP